MDFYVVVGQVVALLQRQGRVSYRALQRQFGLDDDFIADLKEELLFAHPVVDEGGRGLVWTGETEGAPVSAALPDQTSEQSPTQQDQPTAAATPPTGHRTPEAERRQLTVMFCDVVDSTKLSSQLDPEDYRDVVGAYQKACSEVIQRYDGHVAQFLGDGLLVYFGYPAAHEEDAQRAIHTGLGIIEAIRNLNTRLEPDKGVRLAVRLGIHTGLVVVGVMGGAGHQEQLALGEVPNVASRIQGIAEANTLVISSSTFRLIQGYFACQELGEQHLRGVAEPIAVYRVLGETGTQSRIDIAAATRGLTPLVGRESEVTILLECWNQVQEGQGQVILLSGEGGIGKSRLVQVLKEHVAHEPHTRWECRSSPYYQNTALYPLIDLLQRALQWRQDDTREEKLSKLEQELCQYRFPLAETIPLFAPLLSLPIPDDRYPPLHLSPQRQRQKTLERIVAILSELAEHNPVLFILEDLHWTDPTTLEFLALLLDHISTASIYALLTCRPTFQPSWSHRSYVTDITVNRLSQDQMERMAEQIAGRKRLPGEVLQQIVEKTDGVPLFVEEMTKAVLESGTLKDVNGKYELVGSLASLTIPATLQDSLMARLDRLVTAKAVAQYASVIGRQFSYDLLQAASELDDTVLERDLGLLVGAELVYQRGLPLQATYIFKHALIQDIAYTSLLRRTRQSYHRRIAEVLEEKFPETAEAQPELLAYHYTEAGLAEQAIGYWQRAGQRASQRSAYQEAISHFTMGLELLQTLPQRPERLTQELAFQVPLGAALLMTSGHGAPEVEATYTRARALCQQLGNTAELFPVLFGLWRFHIVPPALRISRELGEQLLRLAVNAGEPALSVVGHYAMGFTCLAEGKLMRARTHLEEGITLYSPDQRRLAVFQGGQDPGVACQSYSAIGLWLLGYAEQATTRAREALTQVRTLAHPFSLGHALIFNALVFQFCGQIQVVREMNDEALDMATSQGFALWRSCGRFMQSWALGIQGAPEAACGLMRQMLTELESIGVGLIRPYFLTLLAEGHGLLGQPEAGLQVLHEAQVQVAKTAERWWQAEVYRRQGVFRLALSREAQAEAATCFQQALDVARYQQAKSLELRAATSLARLWQSQGKRQDAYGLLAPVCNWFTEGFDTADLQEAKALLDDLER